MAKEDDLDLDVEGVEPPRKSRKLLIIGIIVVLLLGISATVTLVLTGVFSGAKTPAASEATEIQGKAAKPAKGDQDKAVQKAPLNYVPLDPPFVVNFSADSDIRFLQITLEVGTRNPAVVDSIREHRPAIRNSLVLLFSSQDPQALNAREGKEKLRADTLAEVRKVLKAETGDAGVENVFFTSFVMQ